jgi:hypothetical protein
VCAQNGSGLLPTIGSSISFFNQYWKQAVNINFYSVGGCNANPNAEIKMIVYDYASGYHCNDLIGPIMDAGFTSNDRGLIRVNADCVNAGLFDWDAVDVAPGLYSVYSILTHEVGHLLGLGHTTNNSYANLMDAGGPSGYTPPFYLNCNNFVGRSMKLSTPGISVDDVNGVRAMYPSYSTYPSNPGWLPWVLCQE